MQNAFKNVALALVWGWFSCSAATAHVVLDEPVALAGTGYKAALRISHGCDGAATVAVKVAVPAGFRGARPMPKAGWDIIIRRDPLARPHDNHGRRAADDVTEITWTAAGRENALPDTFFDEFVLRGTLPTQAGPMWFKVLQTCEKGELNWSETPAKGTSIQDLKSPAALLEILPGGATGHSH